MFENIKAYCRNLKVFHKLLTKHRPWDYNGLLIGMHAAGVDMHKYQSTVDHMVSVNRDKACKRLNIFNNTLNRIIEDEYTCCKDFEYTHKINDD